MTMHSTVVVQSHRRPLPYPWIETCVESVRHWCTANDYEYLWLGDELFEPVAPRLLEKLRAQRVVASDLARLRVLQSLLARGYECVVWCDADFLIFDADGFALPPEPYALGREVWIQPHARRPETWAAHVKVHNAFLMFGQGNAFLDFYADTAERLLHRIAGPMPPQFIGPKLLTAIHNVAQCPVLETAGMLSPPLIRELATQTGAAFELFSRRSPQPIAAANLCASLAGSDDLTTATIEACIRRLQTEGLPLPA